MTRLEPIMLLKLPRAMPKNLPIMLHKLLTLRSLYICLPIIL